nr:MAG TPA: hypothetical protein [Bacteriophage sp.]
MILLILHLLMSLNACCLMIMIMIMKKSPRRCLVRVVAVVCMLLRLIMVMTDIRSIECD